MKKILMMHGVNHNMFGHRDPRYYGTATLAEIDQALADEAERLGDIELECFQNNHEGDWVDKLNEAYLQKADAVLINPAAWSFYSLAIHDALEILECPVIEIHMSNIDARPKLGRSVTAPVVTGMITGLGLDCYPLALRAAVALIKKRTHD